MKLIEVVKKFAGGRGEDIEQWIDKFLVAAEITITDADDRSDAKLAKIIPLFLEGPAYTTWKQLSDTDKQKLESVWSALRRSFGISRLRAWQDLKETKFLPGESVDILADEISSALAIITGDKANVSDKIVSCHLIDALPTPVAAQVKLQCGESLDLQVVISCAKSLLSDSSDPTMSAATGLVNTANGRRMEKSTKPRCSGCRRIGHSVQDCNTTCYRCGEVGHLRYNCPKMLQGNDQAEAAVPGRAAPARTL